MQRKNRFSVVFASIFLIFTGSSAIAASIDDDQASIAQEPAETKAEEALNSGGDTKQLGSDLKMQNIDLMKQKLQMSPYRKDSLQNMQQNQMLQGDVKTVVPRPSQEMELGKDLQAR